ncbi:tyrosine-type recombinase/integrase [Herminiimonas fonticola]|uniref:Integrase n=1 Tax=Herminiimonas fonticola TaxID=303380 RepID=A0A4R6G429_9BURK|nr:site-specific integrase [Herminiimonas fonticola]RBA23370.1 Phage integrase family [Herminiimonas fonticola]TDN88375.1 integrase [Herminiimonas fonticola]
MATQKLTTTAIEKYRPTKSDETKSDGNGLSLRFRKGQSGSVSRVWMYTYKVGTKSVYMALGDYDASLPEFETTLYKLEANARLTLATARRIAVELNDWRKNSTDPKEFVQNEIVRLAREKQEREAAVAAIKLQLEAENLTTQDLFDEWIITTDRKDKGAELRRLFARDVLPKIGTKALKSLTEKDIRSILEGVVNRGSNRMAVMLLSDLKQMFRWAEKRRPWKKLIDDNPVEHLEAKRITSEDYDGAERTRTLSADEIKELAAKLPDASLLKRTEICMWIMLSSCCRIGEVTKARWEHIDLDAGIWTIPKENAKNKMAHTIYLSSFALPYFQKLKQLSGKSAWCFPREDDETYVCIKSTTKQIRDRQKPLGGKPMSNRSKKANALILSAGDWVPHDLRRTGATMMQSLGVVPDVIERCLNHVEPNKLRRTYQTYDYATEKREAWQLLGDRLALILTAPDTAIVMRKT